MIDTCRQGDFFGSVSLYIILTNKSKPRLSYCLGFFMEKAVKNDKKFVCGQSSLDGHRN